MEDVPQPADQPYEEGDTVYIYLSDEDPDSRFHGTRCTVLEDEPDDLAEVAGRELEKHHYRLQRVDTGDILPVSFRHADLVPESEGPEEDSL